jgi:hypothetical protein
MLSNQYHFPFAIHSYVVFHRCVFQSCPVYSNWLLKMLSKLYFSHVWISVLLYYIFSNRVKCQEIDWVNCSDHVPPPDVFNTSGVDLQHLPSTLRCGQMVVPMDYSKPLGVENNITLGLAMYRPEQPKGVIFL